MKKIIISIIMLLVVATTSAQTNQYPGTTGTISKTGYTYKYRNFKIAGVEVASDVELYNAANSYIDVEFRYKDGTLPPVKYENEKYFSNSSQTKGQTFAMVTGLFTSQQKTALKGGLIFIDARIDPSTGKVADVYFCFQRNGPFANIPVETYRSIELALKQNLTVTVTVEGRKMNYLQLFWSQKF